MSEVIGEFVWQAALRLAQEDSKSEIESMITFAPTPCKRLVCECVVQNVAIHFQAFGPRCPSRN